MILDDDDDQDESRSYMEMVTSKDTLIILVAGAIWFIFAFSNPNQPMMEVGKWDTALVCLILGIVMKNATFTYLKLRTGQLISDPIHTSTTGEGENMGMFTVFTMGDIDAGSFKMRGKEGTIIVPTLGYERKGKNIATIPLREISMEEIPFSIQPRILMRRDKYCPPYYRGYVSEITLSKHPKSEIMVEETNAANRVVARLREEIKKYLKDYGKYDNVFYRRTKAENESRSITDRLTGKDRKDMEE